MAALGGGVLGKLLATDPGYRGPRVDCGTGHQSEFASYRDKVIDTVLADRSRAKAISARKLVPLPPSPLPDKLYAAIDSTGVPVTAKETAGLAAAPQPDSHRLTQP